MTDKSKKSQLISDLIDSPSLFFAEGRAYELLQEYFEGKPLETLRPLLRHSNVYVRRVAAYIVSELGSAASILTEDIAPLSADADEHVQWCAIESLMACSCHANFECFIDVVRQLESPKPFIRQLSMRLVSNANELQLNAAIQSVEKLKSHRHEHLLGLTALLNSRQQDTACIMNLLNNKDGLLIKYGVIAAKRLADKLPDLIQNAVASEKEDVARFASELLK